MARSTVNLSLSPKLKAMLDKGKLDEKMTSLMQECGDVMLGRSQSNFRDWKNAPLSRAFARWYTGTQKTRGFEKYSEDYEEKKRKRGERRFLVHKGNLWRDAVGRAKVKASPRSVTITAVKGKSADYQAVHQFGSKSVPARPFYQIDDVDRRKIVLILQNKLRALFSGEIVLVNMKK